MLSIKT